MLGTEWSLGPFTIQMLRRLRDNPTHDRMCEVKTLGEVGGNVVEGEDKVALVFPGRSGVLRDPHNFNRTWRAAGGTLYKDVTQYTFRKAVATQIAEASDSKTAAKQLGHSREAITERHYIASPQQAPDSSAVLEQRLGTATSRRTLWR